MSLEKIDFKIQFVDLRFYYFFNNGQIEIDIVPCMGCFCVEVYDINLDLLEPKKCVNAEGYDLDVFGIRRRSDDVWEKALDIANEFFVRYR